MYTEEQISENLKKYVKSYGRGSLYYLLTEDISGKPDKFIYCREFYKILIDNKIDFQDWYDTRILGIMDPNDRPRCPVCGKLVQLLGGTLGYRTFCSTECQLSFTQHDKNSRLKQSDSLHKTYESSPELKQLRSVNMTKLNNELWSDPDSVFNSEEFRSKMVDNGRRVFGSLIRTELHRSRISESLAKFYVHNNPYRHRVISEVSSEKCVNRSVITCKSSWEKDWISHLNNDPSVVKFEWEPIAILVTKTHRYIPDCIVFYDDGRVEMQEVKADNWIYDDWVLEKARAAYKYCESHNMTYRFITSAEIYNESETNFDYSILK